MMKLGLRLRILLFFALIFAVGLAGFVLALWLAHAKAGAALPVAPLIQAALIGGVVLLGVVTVVWLLFDENVARPLLALSSELRSCAHAGVDRAIDLEPARYLGDLAPAAEATSARVRESRREAERAVREASELIAQERNRFATLLRDAPVALILCTRSHRIALYNAEAVARFGCPDGALGLHRPVFDLFPGPALREAIAGIEAGQEEVETLHETGNGERCSLRVSAIHADGDDVSDGYLIACGPRSGGTAPGPRERCIDFYDFGLIRPRSDLALPARCLREIDYVVFDTETTGLEPQRGDEIVQIAGMRIVNGRLLRGEAFDMLVDPGRPIPAGSTEIHGITGEMVAGAPDIATAAARFHRYSRESVLVAHNAPFDLAFLQKNEARTGCCFDQPVLDTVLLSAIVFGAGAEHSLDALAERLDVRIPSHLRHTALGDSAATAEVFLKLLPLLHARGIDTLADALAAEDAIRGAVGMPKLDREPLPA